MDVGPFRLHEPLPPLQRPVMVLALQPWIDVGSVGTIVLSFLEESWPSRSLGELIRPGRFYDFTRYRPMLYRRGQRRVVTLPNTYIRYAQAPDGSHWLLVHALEPHCHGEEYVEGLATLMERLEVGTYCLVGSYYGPVPHTRPPLIVGTAGTPQALSRLQAAGVRESRYEGPTTVLALMYQHAEALGIETISILVQVPAYAQLERDYRSAHAVLSALSQVFGIPLPLDKMREEGEKQYSELDAQARHDPRMQRWIEELERIYEAEASLQEPEPPPLSPELERFLEELERRWEGPPPPDR